MYNLTQTPGRAGPEADKTQALHLRGAASIGETCTNQLQCCEVMAEPSGHGKLQHPNFTPAHRPPSKCLCPEVRLSSPGRTVFYPKLCLRISLPKVFLVFKACWHPFPTSSYHLNMDHLQQFEKQYLLVISGKHYTTIGKCSGRKNNNKINLRNKIERLDKA